MRKIFSEREKKLFQEFKNSVPVYGNNKNNIDWQKEFEKFLKKTDAQQQDFIQTLRTIREDDK